MNLKTIFHYFALSLGICIYLKYLNVNIDYKIYLVLTGILIVTDQFLHKMLKID